MKRNFNDLLTWGQNTNKRKEKLKEEIVLNKFFLNDNKFLIDKFNLEL